MNDLYNFRKNLKCGDVITITDKVLMALHTTIGAFLEEKIQNCIECIENEYDRNAARKMSDEQIEEIIDEIADNDELWLPLEKAIEECINRKLFD